MMSDAKFYTIVASVAGLCSAAAFAAGSGAVGFPMLVCCFAAVGMMLAS